MQYAWHQYSAFSFGHCSEAICLNPTNTRSELPLHGIGPQLRNCARDNLIEAAQLLGLSGDALNGGIHRGRKALRRTRAILALGQRRFDQRWLRLDADIRSLGRGLSALRDAQALVETLERLCESEPEIKHMLPAAIKSASARRDTLLQRALQRDPNMQSRRARLAEYLRRMLRLPWSKVGERTITKALERSMRRIDRAQKFALEHPEEDEAWHRLRRRVRRLRQQHSVVEALAPHLIEHIDARDPRADQLSESQDDALLLARCGSHSPFDPTQRRILRAVARARLARIRRSGRA